MRKYTVMLLTTVVMSAACSNAELPLVTASADGPAFTGPAPTLTTDRTAYIAVSDSTSVEQQWHFSVIATLHNNSDQALYVGNCFGNGPGYAIQSAVQSAYQPWDVCPGGSIGIQLTAHAVRVDTIRIAGPNSFDGQTHAGVGAISGSMVLSYAVATCTDVGSCKAGTIGVASAPFTVTPLP